MPKYQHASGTIVDAVQFKPLPQGIAWPRGVIAWDGHYNGQPRDMSWGFVDTSEGRRHVMADDWILTDAAGGQRVVSAGVFETEYKPVRRATERGFVIYDEFVDMYGGQIRIMKSSLASEPAVWIFRKSDRHDEAAHLNVEQAKRVREALDTFIAENAS